MSGDSKAPSNSMRGKLKTVEQLEKEGLVDFGLYVGVFYVNGIAIVVEERQKKKTPKQGPEDAGGFWSWPKVCFEWVEEEAPSLTIRKGLEVPDSHTCTPVNVGFMTMTMACKTCGVDMNEE